MLEVWSNTKKRFRVGTRINIGDYSGIDPQFSFIRFDPLLWCITRVHNFMVLMDPISESGLFDGSYHTGPDAIRFTSKPINIKVNDHTDHDRIHYGSFTDPVQKFWSVINGRLDSAPVKKVFSQHYVRHRSFKGQASMGMFDLSPSTEHAPLFEGIFEIEEVLLKYYAAVSSTVGIAPSGTIDYYYSPRYGTDFLSLNTFFDYLSSRVETKTFNTISGYTFDCTITNFSYNTDKALHFEYDTHILHGGPGYVDGDYTHYHVFYDSGEIYQVSSEGSDPRVVEIGTRTGSFGVSSVSTNVSWESVFQPFESIIDATYCPIAETPLPSSEANSVNEYELRSRLFSISTPFWDAVQANMFDITALSRDTATVALTRLSTQAFEPSIGKIGAINPLKSLGESLLAKSADAALGDFFRMSWKKILGLGGGAKLVRYRTIISDATQLISSLEVLDSLRKESSRLYTANAHYDYQISLGNRECTIRVRSKVYLELSPFGLLQILIGRQAIIILNDLLALYYTSIPFGEILLTILQLRRVGDYISTRMYYELPMFFVHSYLVESQLTQAELDYTGMSNVTGQKARVTYYFRDISQYLPVLRFSTLVPFYGTGDVGNIIWSLLQQLVGVLSSGR
jgi:hypothetical protein